MPENMATRSAETAMRHGCFAPNRTMNGDAGGQVSSGVWRAHYTPFEQCNGRASGSGTYNGALDLKVGSSPKANCEPPMITPVSRS